jgi:6-pyruvoyltetrahydropterin/6-carboxytetrahydropterin synthase
MKFEERKPKSETRIVLRISHNAPFGAISEKGSLMEILKEYTFEAAHLLPNVPAGHKCRRLHGHSFHLAVHVNGPVGKKTGWVMDFADISAAVNPLIARLDHYYLNEIPGLENPTSENIAKWIWQRLKSTLPLLNKIVIRETCNSGCIYQGDDE